MADESNTGHSNTQSDGQDAQQDWFERNQQRQSQLVQLLDRLQEGPDRFGSVITDLQELTAEGATDTSPTPEERTAWRERMAQQHGPDWRERLLGQMSEQMQALTERMNQPSPLDMDSAIIAGDIEKVRCLLDSGLDPNGTTSAGHTFLASTFLFEQPRIAALLRERGAVVGPVEAAWSGDNDALRALLDAGETDVDATNGSGDSLLALAAGKGHVETVRLLLERGARPDLPDRSGHTPLSVACLRGYATIAVLLREALRAGNRAAPLGLAEASLLGDLETMQRLIIAGGADLEQQSGAAAAPMSPLMAAAGCGHVEAARLLLQAGARVEARNARGQSALSWAIVYGRVRLIHLLIEHGADIHTAAAEGVFGGTYLMDAVRAGQAAAVEALLGHAAPVDAVDEQGRTALQCLCFAAFGGGKRQGERLRIARLLLDAGASVDTGDRFGRTPLLQAAQNGDGELVALLLERGADPHARSGDGHFTPLSEARQGQNPQVIRLIMEAMGPEYALVHAAQVGDTARMAELLEAGVPADSGVHLSALTEKMEQEGFGDHRETPLSAAVEAGQAPAVQLLLRHGAGGDREEMGRLLWFAETWEKEKHEEVVQVLREAGAVPVAPAPPPGH